MDRMSGSDISPLDSVHMQIDPDRRKKEKEEKEQKKEKDEHEEKDENVVIDIQDETLEEKHITPIDNRNKPDVTHENGKGKKIDFTV